MDSSDGRTEFNASAWTDAWASVIQEYRCARATEQGKDFSLFFLCLLLLLEIHLWDGYSKQPSGSV